MEKAKKLLDLANKKYLEGNEIMSDKDFDLLENYVKLQDPTTVCSLGKPGNVRLPVPMWSLDKKRVVNTLENCIIMDKLDGISCLLYDGIAYTRGNGLYGNDISFMIKSTFFDKIPNGFAIRGELVVKKENLENCFKNCRTMVSSYIRRKQFSEKVQFVAYELIHVHGNKDPCISKQMELLSQFCECVFYVYYNNINTEKLEKLLEIRRNNAIYQIDGLVVSEENNNRCAKNLSKNPKYAFAFKQNFKGVETIITDILWKIGKTGVATPVLQVNPVIVEGSTINHVTGHNYEHMIDKGLGINSIVEIVQSGHVIPHVLRVVKKSTNLNIPDDMIVTKTDNGKQVVVPKIQDSRIITSKILFFAKTLCICGLGNKMAENLAKLGYDPLKIVSEGIHIGSKKNEVKVQTNVENALKNCTELQLLTAIQIFGNGFGKNKIKKILEKEDLSSDALQIIDIWNKKWLTNKDGRRPICN